MSSKATTIFGAVGRHPVHPFPARMAPGIALEALSESEEPLRVLDPMMGSGTVPAVARSCGHYGMGIDLDPLAVLISSVWTTSIDPNELMDKASEVLSRAKSRFRDLAVADAYPRNCDDETAQFIVFWFDGYVRRQLTALATSISLIRDKAIKKALWCAFSRLIIAKEIGASLAMDLSHSRPHRVYDIAPLKPFNGFMSSVKRVADNCVDKKVSNRGSRTSIRKGDARKLPIRKESIDLVLTSPPYLNAIDYMRCSKFTLVWMGYSVSRIRTLRHQSVGAEVGALSDAPIIRSVLNRLGVAGKMCPRDTSILARYIVDIEQSVSEVARVLKPMGKAIYVIGENTIRGTFIRNSLLLSALADSLGLELVQKKTRNLPANRRYLPPPKKVANRGSMDCRMRREVVLTFLKP